MEYIELVIQAFTAALSWFTDIITAESYLFDIYFTLCFVSVLIALFVNPFLGTIRGLGSDRVSGKKPGERKTSKSSSVYSRPKEYDSNDVAEKI